MVGDGVKMIGIIRIIAGIISLRTVVKARVTVDMVVEKIRTTVKTQKTGRENTLKTVPKEVTRVKVSPRGTSGEMTGYMTYVARFMAANIGCVVLGF